MAWGMKNWSSRLDEIEKTIGSRGATVQQVQMVVEDLKFRREQLGEQKAKAISDALHLPGGGTKEERDHYRAMALMERMYFNQPLPVQRVVKRWKRFQSNSGLKEVLDMYIAAAVVARCGDADGAYRPRRCAEFADFLLRCDKFGTNPLFIEICQTCVSYLLEFGSMGLWRIGDGVTNVDIDQYFLANNKTVYKMTSAAAIPADAVVVVYKRRDKAMEYSHTMLSVDDHGGCAGANNGAIGGDPGFSRVDLPALIVADHSGELRAIRQPGPPNVLIYARPAAELLPRVRVP